MGTHIPEVEESTKFNFFTSIWIVPLIALVIAGWLAYQYYDQRGPEIRIIFEKNEGLIAGQSQIKYRNVPVGLVTDVKLEKDGEGVVVVARMNKDAVEFLNEHTKFWIVKPEFGLTGVTGLDTLISGTYVQMYSKKGGKKFKKTYHGLNYAYRDNEGGKYFVLKAEKGDSSVKKGTPVYLQNIEVGKVEYVTLGFDDVSVDVIVFIDRPYVPYVHTDSKFWVRGAVSATLNNGSLDVDIAPVQDLIQGAIEFSSTGKDDKAKVPDLFTFKLYPSKSEISKQRIGSGTPHREHFVLKTRHSIANLHIGAPVRYEGFTVGNVVDVALKYDSNTHLMDGQVHVEIDTSVFAESEEKNDTGVGNFYKAVEEGMRAHIAQLNPITGSLYVKLAFDEAVQESNDTITKEGRFAYLPTVDYVPSDIMKSVSGILEKLEKLPLEKLVDTLQQTIAQSRKPIAHADEVLLELKKSVDALNAMTSKKSFAQMPDRVDAALKELERMLRQARKTIKGYDSNSLVTRQISATLKTIKKTSEEMDRFLRMLNRKPNSLIFGDR